MDDLLRIDVPFHWSKECQESFEFLKRKLVEALIFRFPNWSKKFHVHIDCSALLVGPILIEPVEDGTDHPNAYARRKLNRAKRNYLTTEREGLGMGFSLQTFFHYLLDNPFIFYTNHQALKYLDNKPLHHG